MVLCLVDRGSLVLVAMVVGVFMLEDGVLCFTFNKIMLSVFCLYR